MIFNIRGIINLIALGCVLATAYDDKFWKKALGWVLIDIGIILNTASLFYE